MSVDTALTRQLLKIALKGVREAYPGIKTSRAGLTCTRVGGKYHYFFEFEDFKWEGVAYNSFEARWKAWNRYLETRTPKEQP